MTKNFAKAVAAKTYHTITFSDKSVKINALTPDLYKKLIHNVKK